MMKIKNFKYMEFYKGNKIFIYGSGRQWCWSVILKGKAKNSSTSYFSVQLALNKARKFIDEKVIKGII